MPDLLSGTSSPLHGRDEDSEDDEDAGISRLAQLRQVACSREQDPDFVDLESNTSPRLGIEMKSNGVAGKNDVVDLGSGDLSPPPNPNAEFMASFFKEVDSVKTGITAVQSATKRIREITEERMMATSAEAEKELSAELTQLVDSANGETKATKALLEKMSEDTTTHPFKASETRIRENLCNTLHRKFCDVAKDYQRVQQTYRAEITKTVKRQLEIVKPDVSTEEIDDVMRRGGASDVYRAAIMAGTSDPIQTAYADVAGKYADVLKLEQSVQELHQMFLDFALLTEQQGDLLDQIEYQVKSAGEYVEEGNVDIEKAIVYQREIRKRWCCVVILIIIILVIILAVSGVFDQGSDDD
mmetsp:Transcript_29457/g.90127  ORF Transcript_29457/g.90127 Transcript_29457/m.90127 type:complete len:356 (+) Transcript_29457:89-1156(+)|eukprot:CAMPEP_0198646296 /NCGR_PEP_ID=MMETSP1467-20131203/1795_1 /TAXON_ID=1462469 /ORGANISM="unid. sp., Strain CCMP2135" /LENGTH=355 /DNA_ID=CAMNT_0044381821 /DNA_START=17 /DNA_END=1084 /DNA_ORIENTATION=+